MEKGPGQLFCADSSKAILAVLLTVSGGEPLAGTLVMDDGWLTFTATGRDTATWRAPVAEVRLSRLPQTHVAAPLRLDGPGLREALGLAMAGTASPDPELPHAA